MRQTSIQAYQDINQDNTADSQRLIILRHLRNCPDGLSRNQISRDLDITINATCGRCKELLDLKSIYEDGKEFDKITHKQNYILKSNKIIEYKGVE